MRRIRTFFDTNVLLYANDQAEVFKQARALEVLTSCRPITVSTQVLAEFYWNATRKLRLPSSNARAIVEKFPSRSILRISSRMLLDAIDLSAVTGYTIWDAMIIEAAVAGKCDRLLTEDMQHGQVVRGVRIENPFL